MQKFASSLIAAFAVSCISNVASAQPAGWGHRGGVQMLEKSGVALVDHQVLVTIDTATRIANGQMNADGSDLRFFADCTYAAALPYWIESGLGTATTKVWVRVPSLPANATTNIYFAHGNAAATAQSALASVFDGVGGVPGAAVSATNQVSGASNGGVTNSQRGFRFAPKKDMIVVQVGKNAPTGIETRYITIFDFATEAKLYQTQVSGPAGEYTYGDVGQLLWLNKDQQYLLEMYQGDSDGYYWGAAPQVDAEITYFDMRYCNGCTQDTFPTQWLGGMHYGYSDFTFFTRKDASPQPEQTAAVCGNSPTCDADCSVASCGDGFTNPAANEECDDNNAVGTDACTNSCTVAVCGDGVVHAGVEQCDDANTIDTDACRNNCTAAVCGDGVVYAGVEECDDANAVDTDACRNSCTIAVCGDGVVHAGVEACDDGNGIDTDACRNNCAVATCGDGVVQAGVEQCEDGNDVETDACRNNCMNAICGDGVVRAGVEACDDGNDVETDGCRNDCTVASCGDGVVRAGVEACDDGNDVETDGCRNDCTVARCGDGVVRAGVEACDDGNDVETDGCRNDCTAARCGDGVVRAGVEACDDGNPIDTDGCRNDCTVARCGDGVVRAGVEACDDGNQTSGDGCSATCTKEAAVDAGASPDSGTNAETDPTAGPASGDDACSCRVTGGRSSSTPAVFGVALAVAAAGLRRRRRS